MVMNWPQIRLMVMVWNCQDRILPVILFLHCQQRGDSEDIIDCFHKQCASLIKSNMSC